MTDYCYCSALRGGVISAQLLSYYYNFFYYDYYHLYNEGRTAANALIKSVALTVKQKCLKSPTKCFERDLR